MCFKLECTFFINIDSHQVVCSFSGNSVLIPLIGNSVLIPLISVPAVAPEGASMSHLDRLNEEHVGTTMTAD